MKLRFWQKTYIFTLILFLVCLNACILSLTYYSYNRNVTAAENICKSEQFYIEKSFERDYTTLLESDKEGFMLLMQLYGNYYENQQIYLDFSTDDHRLYSTFSNIQIQPQINTISHHKLNGDRYVIITSIICDGRYTLIYGKNVCYLDNEFRSLMWTYCITAASVSMFLAICLFFVLKKLSIPLERLRKTTEAIAEGDFNKIADESGHDEFSLLAKSFNIMVHRINNQIEALKLNAEQKQQLVDNLAHEVRTPLTLIHGYAEYLQKAALSEEEKIDASEYIISESERLQNISEKLLDTAYIKNKEINTTVITVGSILSDVTSKLKAIAESRGVTIENNVTDYEIQGDPVLLNILFYNLVDNAIKSYVNVGTVRLASFKTKNSITVTVTDKGRGMTSEQLAHITEPFYRTDKSRSRTEGGVGLGLALCSQIVTSHKAEMIFQSEPGKGTTVSIKFTMP